MKKLLILSLLILLMSASAMAGEGEFIHFTLHYEDNMPVSNDHGRPSIEVPLVYIEDYTLSFEANHPDYVLIIRDEDGSVVYSTMVYSAQTTVILPSTLSGDYEIQLDFGGSYIFVGQIAL